MLFSHNNILILFFLWLRVNSVYRLALCAFNQCTCSIWINNFSHANTTCKYTIQWKTFNYFITHTTNIHLSISWNRLCKSAFVTIYSPKLNYKMYIYGTACRKVERLILEFIEEFDIGRLEFWVIC